MINKNDVFNISMTDKVDTYDVYFGSSDAQWFANNINRELTSTEMLSALSLRTKFDFICSPHNIKIYAMGGDSLGLAYIVPREETIDKKHSYLCFQYNYRICYCDTYEGNYVTIEREYIPDTIKSISIGIRESNYKKIFNLVEMLMGVNEAPRMPTADEIKQINKEKL